MPPAFCSLLLMLAPADAELAPVVVTATRDERDPLEVAASIDALSIDISSTPGLGIHSSELLASVTGVLARNRQNHAQDEQISIRGFGARASFGVRGVRLYLDGIPATMPDGSGQISHVQLDTAARIEVLRGPFSALYGNSSGGVIQVFSADGIDPGQIRGHAAVGSHGTGRLGVSARGRAGEFGYNVGLSHFQSDGYRRHSRAQRQSANAKLDWQPAADRRLTVVANRFDLPQAQDPLGLTWAQFRQDPRQAVAAATTFDTRKSVLQSQLGAVYEHGIGARQLLRLMAYGGQRRVEQYLAIPPAAQNNPLQAGGLIDLRGDYRGADLRWRLDAELAGRPFDLALGVAADENDQLRRGHENFLGDRLGVRGALRRDEDNVADSLDQYAQANWDIADDWALSAGVRRSVVRFRVDDRYVTDNNPDDSGRARHQAVSPVLGLLYRLGHRARLYAAWGRGFETPTFAELGYRADGGAGLNLNLRPARSRNAELGIKLRSDRETELQLALFRADTSDEIVVATSSGGRSSFQNIARSRRQGLELSLSSAIAGGGRLRAGYTWLDARFRSPFLACSRGCTAPDTEVAAGTSIPGVPRSAFFADARWGGAIGWQGGVSASYVSSVAVNDLGSERAPGHPLFAASLGHGWQLVSGELRVFARIDNLLDRAHVGSVIVNEGNGRFHEPGPGRSALLGLQWHWQARAGTR